MSEYLKKINTAAALVNALGVVGARVRELENKAPDMTSYQMFTQMNDVVNYQADQIAALQAELERDAWVSVEDRLPEIGDNVLVSNGRFVYSAFTSGEEWFEFLSEDEIYGVAHWKPITPPQTEGE